LSVSARESDYRFLIGNYEPPKPKPTSGTKVQDTFDTPGSTVQGPGATGTSEPYGGISGNKIYFYGYLTQSGLAPSAGKIKSHGRFFDIEKRLEYLENSIKLGGYCVINPADKAYFVYLNKKMMSIHVEKFE